MHQAEGEMLTHSPMSQNSSARGVLLRVPTAPP